LSLYLQLKNNCLKDPDQYLTKIFLSIFIYTYISIYIWTTSFSPWAIIVFAKIKFHFIFLYIINTIQICLQAKTDGQYYKWTYSFHMQLIMYLHFMSLKIVFMNLPLHVYWWKQWLFLIPSETKLPNDWEQINKTRVIFCWKTCNLLRKLII